jgi:hypothetical protein
MMITPHDRIVQKVFICCVLVGLLTHSVITPAPVQAAPGITNPAPGSALTTTTVTFTGAIRPLGNNIGCMWGPRQEARISSPAD